MKFQKYLLIAILCFPSIGIAQYQFTGEVDKDNWPEPVYLSLIEDYRKLSGVYPEQIIQKTQPDSLGTFIFVGDHLPKGNHIYKIQTHNCSGTEEDNVHFDGFCPKSKEILFIAKNTDTIALPFSFDQEMFCKVVSTNQKSDAFIKIDSLIHEMQYAFGKYRSTTSQKINAAKWLTTLQDYAQEQNEPLLELYVYSFLSNKSNELHKYYLEDLKQNVYYDELLDRLQQQYPESPYTEQYRMELASDRFLSNPEEHTAKKPWLPIIAILLLLSVVLNLFQLYHHRKKKAVSHLLKEQNLTPQEQKILELILQDKTNKEIATTIFVSVSTVKTHINNLYKKLNVASREEVKSLYTSS